MHFGQLFNAFLPKLSFYTIFVKASKTLIFLGKSCWATFVDIWPRFTGHTAPHSFFIQKDQQSTKNLNIYKIDIPYPLNAELYKLFIAWIYKQLKKMSLK